MHFLMLGYSPKNIQTIAWGWGKFRATFFKNRYSSLITKSILGYCLSRKNNTEYFAMLNIKIVRNCQVRLATNMPDTLN